MLTALGEVHQIVFFLHYDKDEVREATLEALAVLR